MGKLTGGFITVLRAIDAARRAELALHERVPDGNGEQRDAPDPDGALRAAATATSAAAESLAGQWLHGVPA